MLIIIGQNYMKQANTSVQARNQFDRIQMQIKVIPFKIMILVQIFISSSDTCANNPFQLWCPCKQSFKILIHVQIFISDSDKNAKIFFRIWYLWKYFLKFSQFSCEKGRRSLQLMIQSWLPMLTPAGAVSLTLWDRKYCNDDEIIFKNTIWDGGSTAFIKPMLTPAGAVSLTPWDRKYCIMKMKFFLTNCLFS